ncbi:MAG: hypothetical protein GX434_02560 [Peptococcaceae bacterium]|nr:hypothetical protein [Peptococcaceae bacterium]
MDKIESGSLEESFAINHNNFEKDILPYYNFLKVKPLFLVQIPIILPFQIPFNQGTCSTFELQDGEACTFHFSDVNFNEKIYAGIVNENSSMLPVCKSRVEMTYVLNKEITIPPDKDEDLLSMLFDRMIEILNWIILSYLISLKDTDVYRISREMLEPASIIRIIRIEPWEEVWKGIFLTHTDIPYVRNNISQQ